MVSCKSLLMSVSLKQWVLFSVLYVRLREKNSGSAARGEEDSGIPRGWPRSCRLVSGARGPPPEGEAVVVEQMVATLGHVAGTSADGVGVKGSRR